MRRKRRGNRRRRLCSLRLPQVPKSRSSLIWGKSCCCRGVEGTGSWVVRWRQRGVMQAHSLYPKVAATTKSWCSRTMSKQNRRRISKTNKILQPPTASRIKVRRPSSAKTRSPNLKGAWRLRWPGSLWAGKRGRSRVYRRRWRAPKSRLWMMRWCE